ncbi:hypothetical protein CDAR_24151 [Caerostris darwini]|uniref:Uncharacterized protein n=1 Tax=Caerostris darwini TaxID=1538125 RepID=A0AAV4QHC4_9ARAC|nr:hypothetical protein CDAR_24151 [Caerostris darwini]
MQYHPKSSHQVRHDVPHQTVRSIEMLISRTLKGCRLISESNLNRDSHWRPLVSPPSQSNPIMRRSTQNADGGAYCQGQRYTKLSTRCLAIAKKDTGFSRKLVSLAVPQMLQNF